jgi:hypothetical protein
MFIADANIILTPQMATFLYRCPNTGLNVQGWVADAASI